MQSSRFGHVETAFTSHANYKGTSFRLHIVLILILKHDRKQKQFCVLEKNIFGKGILDSFFSCVCVCARVYVSFHFSLFLDPLNDKFVCVCGFFFKTK